MRLRRRPWAKAVIESNHQVALTRDDEDHLPSFDRLEIGSGRGRFLLEKAAMEPAARFLGLEMNYNAFATSVKRWSQMADQPTNVWFLNDTFESVVDRIPLSSLDAVYLNFSDPWPKARQQRRRLTHPDRLAEYYRLLRVGGFVLFKTDNRDLFDASVGYFETFGRFRVIFSGVYEEEEAGDVCTEFEERFRSQGLPIYRIVAVKNTDDTLVLDPHRRPGYVPEYILYSRGRADRITEQTFRLKDRLQPEGEIEEGGFSLSTDLPDPSSEYGDDLSAVVCGTEMARTLVEDFCPDSVSVNVFSLRDGDQVSSSGETIIGVDGISSDCWLGQRIIEAVREQTALASITSVLVGKLGFNDVALLAPEGASDVALASQGYAFRTGGGRFLTDPGQCEYIAAKPCRVFSLDQLSEQIERVREEAGKPSRQREIAFLRIVPEQVKAATALLHSLPSVISVAGILIPESRADDLLEIQSRLEESRLTDIPLGICATSDRIIECIRKHPLARVAGIIPVSTADDLLRLDEIDR